MTVEKNNILKGIRTSNSFSGNTTFFRRDFGTDFGNADVVIQGLPYDLGVSNRPGARFGPRSIREASCQLAWGEVWPWGFDPFDKIAVMDTGDIEYSYGNSKEFFRNAAKQTNKIVSAGAIPFTLGGDHSISSALLMEVSKAHGPVSLLQFDAHADTGIGPKIQHGAMFKIAADAGTINPAKSIQIGLRTPFNSTLGFNTITAVEAMYQSSKILSERIETVIGKSACYVSIDIDCLDPSHAPGTGTPIPGGLTTLQLLEILRALGGTKLNIVGLDLVEVAPDYDHAQITSLAAAQICQESLCLISETKP